MEKISALIDKLQELKNSNAGLQSISYYVQLLQAEILHARTLEREQERAQQKKQDSHIAVILPTAPLTTGTGPATITVETPVATSPEPIVLEERQQPVPVPAAAPAAASTLTLPRHHTSMPKPVEPAPSPKPEPVPEEKKPAFITIYGNAQSQQQVNPPVPPAPAPVFNGNGEKAHVTEKKPETNGVRKELKELNQLVAQGSTSLNDRWRQSHTEVADRLGDMPVKDLRQAIGINDKFQFIQELFRGDVDTYERSVRTINELHSLQEAEYWIERELKIRQGWDDENRTVRQFYNLVKKRFS
ncbi:hypothetical protein SAMN05428949_3060 [Chitinophaga sp. YR627]|uniref:hypothetical protein n=1 Tax=Chitinophaga sp. YR627 TaxID=1881041 RepID=UPI0008DF92F5|nr:hypothetical protein [Chitinophaga sp. YR627]SFN50545.1 hypothetical protein SAMN05428949_3060 [Chitinophaga sp. YR627]